MRIFYALHKFLVAGMEKQRILTVVTGPIGAGKLDFIQQYDGFNDFKAIASSSLTLANEEDPRRDIFHPLFNDQRNMRLMQVMQRRRGNIIVDYPLDGRPGELERLMRESTAKKNLQIGILGLYVKPENTLRRAFRKSADGVPDDRFPFHAEDCRAAFSSWIRTYRNFPVEFQRAAQVAHGAQLLNYEDKAESPIIATWIDGTKDPVIEDCDAWQTFLNLGNLDPEMAFYTAIKDPETGPDIVFHNLFGTTPKKNIQALRWDRPLDGPRAVY